MSKLECLKMHQLDILNLMLPLVNVLFLFLFFKKIISFLSLSLFYLYLGVDDPIISDDEYWGKYVGSSTASLLDFSQKDYRNMIATNSISKFEFRQYLFARQASVFYYFDWIVILNLLLICLFFKNQLLISMGEYVKMSFKAVDFINTMTQELQKHKVVFNYNLLLKNYE